MINGGRQNWECRHSHSQWQVEEDETKSEKILRCSSEKANEELKP